MTSFARWSIAGARRTQARCPAFAAARYNIRAWSASAARSQETRTPGLEASGSSESESKVEGSSAPPAAHQSQASETSGQDKQGSLSLSSQNPAQEADDDAAVLKEVLRPFPNASKTTRRLEPRTAALKADETVEDIFADLFAAAEPRRSSKSAWDAALGPVGGKIKTPEDSAANKPSTGHGFTPRFLTQTPRQPFSRDNLAPAEQGKFKAILDNLFASNNSALPKFPRESPDIASLRSPADRGHLRKDYLGRTASAGPVAKPIGRFTDVAADVDADFDSLKEEVYRQATDLDVLNWAVKHVFIGKGAASTPDGLSFSPTYPLILTFLIDLFRDRFNNPELSLAIFAQARSHSHESYLIGCSTAAYNAMLKTRWDCFLDLAGVEEGVKEMLHHGVGWDKQTTQLISRIVGTLSQEAAAGPSGLARVMLQHGEDVLARLAELENEVERYTEAAEARHRRVASQRMHQRRSERDYASVRQMAQARY